MQKKNLLSRSGLIVSTFMVVALAFTFLVIPTQEGTRALAETCTNAPQVPTFNPYPVMYVDDGPLFCHDLPAIDAALHTSTGEPVFSRNAADWQNGLQLNNGEFGVAAGYIHNGAVNNLPLEITTARNVRIKTETDTSVGTSHQLRVTYTADNAAPFTQTFTVNTPAGSRLEVIPNSGNFYTVEGILIEDMRNLDLGTGNTYNLGDLDACFEYSLSFVWRFKVVAPTAPTDTTLAITKQVRNITDNTSYADSLNADQNDQVGYKIIVTNNGPAVANTVTMTDLSVAGISVDAGSTTVGVADDALLTPDLWSGAIPGTINLGNLQPGEHRIIKYTGRVTVNTGTLTNTARAQASNASTVQDSASVIVTHVNPTNPDLEIKKWVKNNTTGTGYNDSQVDARTGDRVNFKITVTNDGDATVNNVVMTDRIPSGLEFDDTVSGDGTPSYNGTTFSVNFGSIAAGRSKTVEFQAKVLATGTQTICNVAKATGSNVNEVSDDACVKIIVITKPGNPNIELSKRAWNDTKNVDATTVNAVRGDYITYSLVTRNTGNANAVNFVISDDLSQVLSLSDMVNLNGGTLNGNTITYPGMTIRPGETIVKTFQVRIKTSLSPNLSYQLRNTYGNTVVINVPGNVVFEAPKTGAAGTSAAVFAGLITAGFVTLRKGRSILKFIFA
jgi:uncharacterized repeat protein (TIGR01451 family)/fimbrial isopeptide formation D2 family protein